MPNASNAVQLLNVRYALLDSREVSALHVMQAIPLQLVMSVMMATTLHRPSVSLAPQLDLTAPNALMQLLAQLVLLDSLEQLAVLVL